MQYKVPQDVQREDTIVGPLTLKQMIILAVGGGLAYAVYISLAQSYFIEIWLPPVAIISLITLAIAFLKIHNLTFTQFILNAIEYNILPKKRTWIQGSDSIAISESSKKEQKKEVNAEESSKTPKNIEELSRILDQKHNYK